MKMLKLEINKKKEKVGKRRKRREPAAEADPVSTQLNGLRPASVLIMKRN